MTLISVRIFVNLYLLQKDTNYCLFFFIVFVKPVRGLVRELLQYLVDDGDHKPMSQWISCLSGYLDAKPTATR